MYEHIEGRLGRKTPAFAVVDAGGVGYALTIPLSTYERLPAEGAHVRLLTELVVREDAHRLFGFATPDERSFFRMLQRVGGVGPAVALQVVSSVPFAEFRRAVVAGDAARLRTIRGIGRKLSERLVVELRDAVSAPDLTDAGAATAADPVVRDALLALEALGFSRSAADEALVRARAEPPPARDAGELVRRALRHL